MRWSWWTPTNSEVNRGAATSQSGQPVPGRAPSRVASNRQMQLMAGVALLRQQAALFKVQAQMALSQAEVIKQPEKKRKAKNGR